jgi:hypothetical protein
MAEDIAWGHRRNTRELDKLRRKTKRWFGGRVGRYLKCLPLLRNKRLIRDLHLYFRESQLASYDDLVYIVRRHSIE